MANIGSYMGGVDLWKNEDGNYDNFRPQSMHDKLLEIVCFTGTWHLGRLQVSRVIIQIGSWIKIFLKFERYFDFVKVSIFCLDA